MINLDSVYTIIAPSDFKLELTNIKDKEGNLIPLSETKVFFLFADTEGNKYKCVHNPFESSANINCVTDYENNKLTLVFQNYKLDGFLYCKMGVGTQDSDFSDEYWNSYEESKKINIKIICK